MSKRMLTAALLAYLWVWFVNPSSVHAAVPDWNEIHTGAYGQLFSASDDVPEENVDDFINAILAVPPHYAPTTYYIDTAVGNDANVGTSQGAGNAWATIGKFRTAAAAGDIGYVKASGTYTVTANSCPPAGSSTAGMTRLIGYTTTPGDNGQATVSTTTASLFVFDTANYVSLENIIVDGNSTTGVRAFRFNNSTQVLLLNCKAKNCGSYGVLLGSASTAAKCEVTGCGADGPAGSVYLNGANATLFASWIHGNVCTGVYIDASGGSIKETVIDSNTGASSDGIQVNGSSGEIANNTIRSSGRDGIRYLADANVVGCNTYGNLLHSNVGQGMKNAGTTNWAWVPADYNAFYSNGGLRTNLPAGLNDVTLSGGDPLTGGSAPTTLAQTWIYFTPNAMAGAGALIRAAGYPPSRDIGAVQHADPAALIPPTLVIPPTSTY